MQIPTGDFFRIAKIVFESIFSSKIRKVNSIELGHVFESIKKIYIATLFA